jgi:hypothetical protein
MKSPRTILNDIKKKKNDRNKYLYIMTPLNTTDEQCKNTGYLTCNLSALFFSILDPNQIFRKSHFLPLGCGFRIIIHKIDDTIFIDSRRRLEMYIERLKEKNNIAQNSTPTHFCKQSMVQPFDSCFIPESLPSNALEVWDELHNLCDEHCTSFHSFRQMFYFLEGYVVFWEKKILTLTQLIELILKNENKVIDFEFCFIPKVKKQKMKKPLRKNRHF